MGGPAASKAARRKRKKAIKRRRSQVLKRVPTQGKVAPAPAVPAPRKPSELTQKCIDAFRGCKGVTVCLMAYRTVEPETVDCLIRDVPGLAPFTRVSYRRSSNDALVSRARSRVATEFLANCQDDVLVMIDHDSVWLSQTVDYPGDLVRIAASCLQTKGLVGGVVPKRAFGKGIACRFPQRVDFRIGVDQLVPCLYVGSAFMAIHRQALEALCVGENALERVGLNDVIYYPFFATMIRDIPGGKPGQKEELSEDWAICARLIEKNIPVHVDALPMLAHKGEHMFTVADAFDKGK